MTLRELILSKGPLARRRSAHLDTLCLVRTYLRSIPQDHSMRSDYNSVSIRSRPPLNLQGHMPKSTNVAVSVFAMGPYFSYNREMSHGEL